MSKETIKVKSADEATTAEIINDKNVNTAKESTYKADELAENAKAVFNTRPECVITALKVAGKSECTVAEAKKLIEKFLKKVK